MPMGVGWFGASSTPIEPGRSWKRTGPAALTLVEYVGQMARTDSKVFAWEIVAKKERLHGRPAVSLMDHRARSSSFGVRSLERVE
jgi:hypothetical protein